MPRRQVLAEKEAAAAFVERVAIAAEQASMEEETRKEASKQAKEQLRLSLQEPRIMVEWVVKSMMMVERVAKPTIFVEMVAKSTIMRKWVAKPTILERVAKSTI